MKFFHLSDLHLGKRVNAFSMLEDQNYILQQILSLADTEHPNAVVIAGDVYDKSVPSGEAVQLFDWFLCQLAQRKLPTFIISGNHDSPERLSFGGRLMESSGIYLSPIYNGVVSPITVSDAYGPINFYLLPFVKPAHVRRFFPDAEIETYTDALACAVNAMEIPPSERNVLVTHQFVTGASRSDSEELSVGGSDNVDAAVFDSFDYVALGHIHGPQNISTERIRYCGTPLKYSFSEANHHKSVTVVELGAKGELGVHTLPLTPLHDLRELRGTYNELTYKPNWVNTNTQDYLHITLTDEEDVPDAMAKLRIVYPNLMKLDYDNLRTRTQLQLEAIGDIEKIHPMELFEQFYTQQNNQPLSEQQAQLVQALIGEIWKEDV